MQNSALANLTIEDALAELTNMTLTIQAVYHDDRTLFHAGAKTNHFEKPTITTATANNIVDAYKLLALSLRDLRKINI